MLLRKTFKFEASHILPRHKGKCSRLHGHSWVLHVFVEGERNEETGFVKDYAEISDVVKPLIERLDHRHFGQWFQDEYPHGCKDFMGWEVNAAWAVPGMSPEFYPSSENLLIWIGHQLRKDLSWSKLALEETCTSYCELTWQDYCSNYIKN